jgi:osmotically-inducible protein OsmY
VGNSLEIKENLEEPALPESDTDFLQKVKDATTTAQVKTRLIGNENIAAGDIDVDTRNNVVRLSGMVRSDVERQLAEFIARNTSGVLSVWNELEISRSG